MLVPPATAAPEAHSLPVAAPIPLSAIESPLGSEQAGGADAFTAAISLPHDPLTPKASAAQLLRDLRAAMIAELYKSARQAETEEAEEEKAEVGSKKQSSQSAGTAAVDAGIVLAAEGLDSPSPTAAPDVGPLPDDGAAAETAHSSQVTRSEEASTPLSRLEAATAQPGSVYSAAPPLPPRSQALGLGCRQQEGDQGVVIGDRSPPIVVAPPRLSASHPGAREGSPPAENSSEESLSARRLHATAGDDVQA